MNAIETIVPLKWTFILKSHHLFDSGQTPPNGHTAYCAAIFSPRNKLSEEENESPNSNGFGNFYQLTML